MSTEAGWRVRPEWASVSQRGLRVAIPVRIVRGAVIGVCALALLVWTLVPLYSLIMVSIVDREELITRPGNLYPHAPNLRQYISLLQVHFFPPGGGFVETAGYNDLPLHGWLNSALVALAVVPLTLVISLPAAYAFSRLRFRFRNWLLAGLVLTRVYPPVSVLIPFDYFFTRVGLTGGLLGLVIAHLTLTVPLITWVMSGFFGALPPNLERAARVDGLTRLQALVRVVVPVSRPGFAVATVIAFITTWNEFFFALILTNGSHAQTAPLNVAYAGAPYIVLSILPALVLALWFQRSIRSLNIVDPL